MKVGDVDQVLPVVRYWIPHIRVISPEGMQEKLEMDLARYFEATRGRVDSGRSKKESS